MPFRICFPRPDGTRRCVDIPVLVDRFPHIGPDPGPWITGLDRDLGNDLLVLGQMNALSRSLSAEARPAFDAAFQQAARGLHRRMPADVTLELGEARAAAE